MKPHATIARWPAYLLATAALTACPAFAQEVIFTPGTGDSARVSSDAAPVAQPADDISAEPFLDKRDSEAEMRHMAERMEDPVLQDNIAHMAEKMGAALMQLPVGKFAAAIEKARPGVMKKSMREDALLADVAGPDADAIPAMLGAQSKMAMSMMSGFAQAFASMMPEFQKMGKEMQIAMSDAKAKRR